MTNKQLHLLKKKYLHEGYKKGLRESLNDKRLDYLKYSIFNSIESIIDNIKKDRFSHILISDLEEEVKELVDLAKMYKD